MNQISLKAKKPIANYLYQEGETLEELERRANLLKDALQAYKKETEKLKKQGLALDDGENHQLSDFDTLKKMPLYKLIDHLKAQTESLKKAKKRKI
jgi:hypothetical protein